MPLDVARWQIDILAADKTATAFDSFDKRLRSAEQNARRSIERMNQQASRTQADAFARLAAASPSAQADRFAKLAATAARGDSAAKVARLAETSGDSLAAMYGAATVQAVKLNRAQELLKNSNADVGSGFAFMTRTLGPLVGVLSAAALAHQGWRAGMAVGALKDEAQQLLLTTEQLQAYRALAAQSGISNEQLDQSIVALVRSMGSARDGSDELIQKFDRLGVKLLDARGKLRGPADVLPELSRGLLKVGSDTERNALMGDLLSRSGSRMVTVLEAWAQGNDKVVATARAQGAIAGPEAIANWDKLNTAMTRGAGNFAALFATISSPAAGAAADLMGRLAQNTERAVGALNNLPKDASFMDKLDAIFGGRTGPGAGGLRLATEAEKAQDALAASQARLRALEAAKGGGQGSGPAFDGLIERQRQQVAEQEAVYRAAAKQAENAAALARLMNDGLPAKSGPAAGVGQPTGKTAGAAGVKLDVRLKELQSERGALEKAVAAFDMSGLQTVDEIDRRLDAQVKLDKKIFDVLKDVPPSSALAQQLTQEATSISQLTQRLDERKRLLTEGQQVIQQYGDGTWAAARATDQLNKLLAAGVIDQGTYNAALKASTLQTDDMARAYRGAAGGADAFIAGIEQSMADMSRANSAFEMGRQLVDELSNSIAQMATGAEMNFGRILQSFLGMMIQMEMRAMASNIWNMFSGSGSTTQGIGGFLSSLLTSAASGAGGGGPLSVGGIPTIALAGGGDYQAGQIRLVGEHGPEVDFTRQSGRVLNQDQMAEMFDAGGGGGVTVVINNTNQFGSVVSRAEMEDAIARNADATRKAAIAGVLEAKARGGDYRSALRR